MVAHRLKGYGLVLMTNGDNGGALMQELRRKLQQTYAWDVFDQPIPRTYGPGRGGLALSRAWPVGSDWSRPAEKPAPGW